MRTFLGIMLAMVGVAAPVSVRAADRDKAMAVIEQAVKAHGGAEALNKAQKRSRSGQGVAVFNNKEVPLKTEETVRFPDCCRVDLKFDRFPVVLVLNGEKGWYQPGGATQEMGKEMLKEKREELFVWWLMTLTPLLKDDFELKLLDDAKVNGQDASVIKASRKDHPTVRLYFDKKSSLLVKMTRRATEAGVPLTKEYLYSDHKDYDGVKWPAKELTTIGGNKLSEVKFTSYKVLDRVEDKTFDKP